MRTWLLVPLVVATVACGGERVARVGVIGRNAVLQGADLASREVNGKNGINGTPMRAERADSAVRTPTAARQAAEKLANDTSVKFILQQSPVGLPPNVQRVYDSRGVPVLVIDPVLEKPGGRWVFHLLPSARDEALLMAGQAEKLWHPTRVAIVHSPDPYGVVLSGELRYVLPRGTPVVLDTVFQETPDTTVAAALERTVSAANPDVLFWVGPPRVLAILLVRLRQHLPNVRIMGSDATEAKRIYDNEDGTFSGLVFVRAADPSVDTARYNNFQYRYSIWMGGQGTSDAVLSYDVTAMLADAMRAGAVTRQQLRDYLYSLGRTRPPYNGVTGPIAFDSLGVIRRGLGLAEVREDGVKPVPLQP